MPASVPADPVGWPNGAGRKEHRMLLEKEKTTLSLDDLEAQTAVELPEREMLGLVTIIITNVLNNNTVTIEVNNNKVAVQVCAIVNLLDAELFDVNTLECQIQQ
jgi:hypothetical protein